MSKVIFCKYNQSRNPKFQTKTTILETDVGKKIVTKGALRKEAEEHVESFPEKFLLNQKICSKLNVLPCELNEHVVVYDYIEGQSLDDLLRKDIYNVDVCVSKIKKLFEKYFTFPDECICDFSFSKEYTDIFGNVDCSGENCICPANLDMTFDNLYTINDQDVMIFDYEWTYNFPVPLKFIKYRTISRFYDKYFPELSSQIDFEEFVAKFDISRTVQKKFEEMERSFIQMIYQGGESVVVDVKHQVNRIGIEDIDAISREKQRAEEKLKQAEEKIKQICNETKELKGMLDTIRKKKEQNECDYEDLQVEFKRSQNAFLAASQQCEQLNFKIALMETSLSWKLTTPLRTGKKILRSLKNDGIRRTYKKIYERMNGISSPYGHVVPTCVLKQQRKEKFKYAPKISIITPLFNTPGIYLKEMLESVQNQTYSNWELCAVNFSSADNTEVDKICKEYAQKDKRIIYRRDPDNKGISENTNTCLLLATGEYIAMLDHDDLLHPSAFFEVVKKINEENSDFVYTDEIKFEGDLNHVFAPNFKPDFSADELRVHNYICHLNVYKKELLEKVGNYRKECEGSQDHDMVLRLTEVAEHISHIPKLLYYWRVHPNSVATAIEAKPYATWAGIHAVEMQWERMGFVYKMESIRDNIPCYRIKVPDRFTEKVHVVIWGSDDLEKIRKTICSVKNNYKEEFVVSIVTNHGSTAGLLDGGIDDLVDCCGIYIQNGMDLELQQVNQILINRPERYVWFIRAGIELLSQKAVQESMVFVTRKDIAAVDAKIFYRSGRIFSGGVISSEYIFPHIQFRCNEQPGMDGGCEDAMIHVRNVSAVSGLCTMISKDDWLQIPQGISQGCNPFIAQSIHAEDVGKRLIWNAHVLAQGDLMDYKEYFDQHQFAQNDTLIRDPYYPDNIRRYGLE